MELRNAWFNEDQSELRVDGQLLGQPGDDTDVVELATIELDATVGSDAFEINDSGDMIATVGGTNYAVFLCQVRQPDGRLDDKLVFIGVRTSVAPG